MRHQKNFKGKSKTDPSFKKSACINNIVDTYKKTGHLPTNRRAEPIYSDTTNVPLSLNAAFDLVQTAVDRFYELPAVVRKMMDNDPTKLEEFISNPKNKDICLEHGILLKKESKNATNSTNSKEGSDSSDSEKSGQKSNKKDSEKSSQN